MIYFKHYIIYLYYFTYNNNIHKHYSKIKLNIMLFVLLKNHKCQFSIISYHLNFRKNYNTFLIYKIKN